MRVSTTGRSGFLHNDTAAAVVPAVYTLLLYAVA